MTSPHELPPAPTRARPDTRSYGGPGHRLRPAGILTAVLALCSTLLALGGTGGAPAVAATGSDRFWAGQVYTGEFGAPSILFENGLYYAYATNTDGNNLPLLTSPDLVTWTAREAWPTSAGYSSWKGYNDAMPFAAPWAPGLAPNNKPGIWAPSVAKLQGRYVNAYTVQVKRTSNRHCLSLATAPEPTGPFRDRTKKTLHCSSDPMGSIDPAWLQYGKRVYLIWKNAGVPGSKPTQVMVRRMTKDGLGFYPGSRQRLLLQTAEKWEGNVIEAPSPIVVDGRIYLFYSGNKYYESSYAIGYAVCESPLGPCKRRGNGKPLLASGGKVEGPGAQSAIIDHHGKLRLAYSAWEMGRVGYPKSAACRDTAAGCNQRRMYVATLGVQPNGDLTVLDRG